MTYPLSPSLIRTVPDGDTNERSVCEHCGLVNYQNPKIVVGSVVRHEGKPCAKVGRELRENRRLERVV